MNDMNINIKTNKMKLEETHTLHIIIKPVKRQKQRENVISARKKWLIRSKGTSMTLPDVSSETLETRVSGLIYSKC